MNTNVSVGVVVENALNLKFKSDVNVTIDNFYSTYELYLYGSRKDATTSEYINDILSKSIISKDKLIEAVYVNMTRDESNTSDKMKRLDATDIRKIINNTINVKDLKIILLKNGIAESVIDIIIDEKAKKNC